MARTKGLFLTSLLFAVNVRAEWPAPPAAPSAPEAKAAEPVKSDGQKAVENAPVPKIVDTPADKEDPNVTSFSGVVNVLRQGQRVEVVFRNGDTYSLPRGSKQHQIYNALAESEKTGKAVQVEVDTRSGVIRSVGGGGNAGGGAKTK